MPMEKEIAALKEKLTGAEEKIKELEASKVRWNCNRTLIYILHCASLMQISKVKFCKREKGVLWNSSCAIHVSSCSSNNIFGLYMFSHLSVLKVVLHMRTRVCACVWSMLSLNFMASGLLVIKKRKSSRKIAALHLSNSLAFRLLSCLQAKKDLHLAEFF